MKTESFWWVLCHPWVPLGVPPSGFSPGRTACGNVHIFIPFPWFLPWGKTDRRRKEMWESVCVLVLICWKRGLWVPFLGYGNVMNEVSWRKQLLQSSQWTAWLVPLFLQFAFFQMVLYLLWLSFIIFFPIFPFYPLFPFFPFTFPDSYSIEAIVQKRITRVVRSLPMAKVWWPVPECSTLTYRSPLALYRVLSDQILASLEKAFCLCSISIPCLWCSISSMCSFSGAQWGKTHLLCECSDIALMEAM